MACIAIDRNFIDWVNKFGHKQTVTQYVKHNYSLPKLDNFVELEEDVLTDEQIQKELEKLLPKNTFGIENINKIVNLLPKEARAAFFNKVLYFGDKATRKDVAEEAFHAIFQTLISPEQKAKYLEAGKKILIDKLKTQPRGTKVKEGVDTVFKENPKLANIGTQEQYSVYLNTIFPDSKVKDILYHGTRNQFEKFEKKPKERYSIENETQTDSLLNGIFFTDKQTALDNYTDENRYIKSSIVNIQNPFISEDRRSISNKNIKNEDGVITTEFIGDTFADVFVVFEPEQIHILGSKQDIQKFQEFVSKPKEITVKDYIQELREKYPATYSEMTDREAMDRTYEETLAEEFVEWYSNSNDAFENQLVELSSKLSFLGKASVSVADMLLRFFNWLKNLFTNLKNNQNELELFFNTIKKGGYRKSNIINENDAYPATRLIEVSTADGVKVLSDGETNEIIRNISQLYLKTLNTLSAQPSFTTSKSEVMDAVLTSIGKNLESFPLQNWKQLGSLFEKERYDDIFEEYTPNESYVNLKEDVFKYLSDQFGESTEDIDEEEDIIALWSDASAANEKAPVDSMSKWLKGYIGTTGTQVKDDNGIPVTIGVEINNQVVAVPLIEVVDTNRIYYGLARALSNTQHEIERLKKLKEFSALENGYASNAFFNKIVDDVLLEGADKQVFIDSIDTVYEAIKASNFKDIGLINNLIGLDKSKSYILQQVLKGFDFWQRDNWINTISKNKKGVLESAVYSANANSVVNNQINAFKDGLLNYVQNKTDVSKLIKSLSRTALTKEDLDYHLGLLKELTKAYGMPVSPTTLKFILAAKHQQLADESTNEDDKASYQKAIKDFFPKYEFFESYIGKIDADKILALYKVSLPSFDVTKLEEWNISGETKLLAEVNSYFDEGLVESSYKSADGKNIYTYQFKTLHLSFLNHFFRNEKWWDEKVNGVTHEYRDGKYLTQNKRFQQDNYFTNKYKDPKWKSFLTRMRSFSIDGLNFEGEATTFGNMANKDFNVLALNLAFKQTTKVEMGLPVRPMIIGVLESKRTVDLIDVPDVRNVVTKEVEGNDGFPETITVMEKLLSEGNMTQATETLIKNEIRKEYERIQEEGARIRKALNTIYNKLSPEEKAEFVQKPFSLSYASISQYPDVFAEFGDVFEGFHTGKLTIVPKTDKVVDFTFSNNSSSLRALQFSDALKGFVTNTEFETLQTEALANQVFNPNTISSLNSQFEKLYQETLKTLTSQGIYVEGKFPFNPYVKIEELKEYMLSDMLNTIFLNQLIHGDMALLYKNDGVDMNKRFGGRNAALVSMKTGFVNEELGIDKAFTDVKFVVGNEIKGKSAIDGGEIDIADAQTYQSVRMKRNFLHSQGKLTKPISDLLTRIELGAPLTKLQEKWRIDNNVYFNVDKPVGFNSYSYIKTGAVMLTKQLTSRFVGNLDIENLPEVLTEEQISILNDTNNWKAKPGMEFLHSIREAMYENDFDLYLPKSASKMLTANLYNADYKTGNVVKGNISNSIMKLDADFYGMQLENPAGKLRIFDPSQNQEISVNELSDTLTFTKKGVKVFEVNLQDEYQKLLSIRDNVMMEQAVKELYDENGFLWKNFLQKAQETIAGSGGDLQTLTFFTPDEKGEKVYNPNMSITLEKFVSLFFSHFSRGVLQQKVAGDSLAHISSFGFKPLKKVVVYKYKGKDVYSWVNVAENADDYEAQIDSATMIENDLAYDESDDFSQLEENGDTPLIAKLKALGEGAYFTDELRHIKPKWNVNENGEIDENNPVQAWYTEAMLPTYSGISINQDSKYMQGVRIPSQDKHSAVNIEWIGYLPSFYGNTIATAKEIVQLSGSDFDIDKLFLTKPELKRNGKKYDNTFEDFVEFQANENKAFKRKLKERKSKDIFYQTKEKELEKLLTERKEYQKMYDEYIDYFSSIDISSLNKERENLNFEIETLIEEKDLQPSNKKGSFTKKINKLKEKLDDVEYKIEEKIEQDGFFNPETGRIFSLVKDNRLNSLLKIYELKEIEKGLIELVLKELQLPSSEQEFVESNIQNHGYTNNELLAIKQKAVTNEDTLKAKYYNEDGNEISRSEYEKGGNVYKVNAIYKTAATQDELKNELANDEDFKGLFENVFGYSVHSWLAKSLSHKNTTTGKRNIGVAVNANLLAIVLKRMGVTFNNPVLINYGDKMVGNAQVENLVYGNKRLFDMISTLISAATDEAKDQQNAKYNLTQARLNIVIPLLLQGHDMKTAIAFVNHPSLIPYFRQLDVRNNKTQSEEEQTNRFVKPLEILMNLFKGDGGLILSVLETSTSQPLTQKAIIEDLKNNTNEVGKRVLQAAIKAVSLMDELAPLVDFIKLKRGFGKTTEDWEKLVESYQKLTTPIDNPQSDVVQKFNESKLHITNYANLLFINPLTEMETKMQNLFVHYKDETKKIKSIVSGELKPSTSRKQKEVVEEEMLSYLYSQIYYKSLTPEQIDLYKRVYENPQLVVDKLKALYKFSEDNQSSEFLTNSFLNKIKFSVNNNTIEIPTFTKMSGKDQTSLIDGFESLFVNTLNLNITETIDKKSVTVDKNLANELFAYFVVKDGWLFKRGSLSKAISPFFFKQHSSSLDDYLSTPDFFGNVREIAYFALENFVSNDNNHKFITPIKSGDSVFKLKDQSFPLIQTTRKSIDIDLSQANKYKEAIKNEGENPDEMSMLEFLSGQFESLNLSNAVQIQQIGDDISNVLSLPIYLYNKQEEQVYKLESYSVFNPSTKKYEVKNNIDNLANDRVESFIRKMKYVVMEKENLNGRKTNMTKVENMEKEIVVPKVSSSTNPKDFTNYSGDAKGSDKYWEAIGKQYGIGKQVNYTVKTMDKLTKEQLEEVEEAYRKVASQLGRKVLDLNNPEKAYAAKLVRRDYLQAKAADAVFAVSSFEDGNYKQMKVKGGTAYAVQSALNLGKSVYFFDQELNKWFLLNLNVSSKPVELLEAPRLTSKFAGIGTRELNEKGKKAIEDVYKNTFTNETIQLDEDKNSIYFQLGNKTESGNVVIKAVYQKAGVDYAKSINGIFSLRVNDTDKHFGNPFSSDKQLVEKDGLIQTKSTKESVEKYIDWVINSQEKRAQWIREVLKSGILKNKPIVYYKELGEPSHATALDYLINKYDWSKLKPVETDESEFSLIPEDEASVIEGEFDDLEFIPSNDFSDQPEDFDGEEDVDPDCLKTK